MCQITCAKLQPWRSPDSNKHAQLVTELPRSSNPGPRAKTTLASCHPKCIPGESIHRGHLDAQRQRRFQPPLRGRDENYFGGSVFSAVESTPADAIVPSLDMQRQRLGSFVATLPSFAYAKNVSIKMKDFPLLTIHNL